ncbi:probable E3 ubiquitin-protein ligase LUL4 [Aristolochia californica]|uniref:probable E3 ubiquitin-protein ligase LUL4 n=1 Tax=Aristolochia californica TaxID=171875 RepID=UPI0035D9D863
MGQSVSHRRRHDQRPQSYPPQLISSSSTTPSLLPPPPAPPLAPQPPPPPPPPNYVFAANAPYPSPRYPFPVPPAPFGSQYPGSYGGAYRYDGPPTGQFNYPYYANQTGSGWVQFRPSSSSPWPVIPPQPPAPYVEHNRATKVKNVINVRKETIRMEVDDENPDYHLVSFTFDAVVDGSITVYYFAKEGENCSFSPLYLDIVPVSVPFQKGSGQKFRQPSGTGIDFGFFALDQLSKPLEEDAYPLVISAQAPSPEDGQFGEPQSTSGSAQITQAILEKRNDEHFQVKVVKQILWVDGIRYELREIFGIGNSTEEEFDDNGSGKECVICMSEPKDTAVLPCRHMCMCSECAKILRFQSNKCPICRQPVEQLIEIKVKKDEQ